MSSDNKDLVYRWFEEVWNKGRAAAIDGIMATRCVVHGLGADLHGPEGFKPFHASYFTGMVFVRVENGKVIEGWNNFDQLGMLQQLRVFTAPA